MLKKVCLIFCIMTILCCLVGCESKSKKISILQSEVPIDQYIKDGGAKALFIYDKNNVLYKFAIYGNTGYDEDGKDIVASALSALSINTINSLLSLTDIDIKYNSTPLNDQPYLECYIEEFKDSEQQKEYELFIESLKLGVEAIEDAYGSQYVDAIEVH